MAGSIRRLDVLNMEISNQGVVAGHEASDCAVVVTRRHGGFTLVEILVAVAIISLLIAILLPMLGRWRNAAHTASCLSNLHNIYTATAMYSFANNRKLPDGYTVGNHAYRMAPGKMTPGDPSAIPERYGWAYVLDQFGSMKGTSQGWVCPAAQRWMQDLGNTYAFINVDSPTNKYNIFRIEQLIQYNPNFVIMWDNYNLLPGLSGFRGKFNGYNIPVANQIYPHNLVDNNSMGTVGLYVGGNARLRGHGD